MVLDEREINWNLKSSMGVVGKLYPVLIGKQGEIIDGIHRLKVDPNWPKIQVEEVDSEEKRLLARLISNVCRRDISPKEKTELLRMLGNLCLKQGLAHRRIARVLSEKTGMSYRWVMKYIPDAFKVRPGLGGRKKQNKKDERLFFKNNVARAAQLDNMLLVPPRLKIADVSHYSNTNFVTVLLDICFFQRLNDAAKTLGVDATTIINNALLLALQKTEQLAKHDTASIITPTVALMK